MSPKTFPSGDAPKPTGLTRRPVAPSSRSSIAWAAAAALVEVGGLAGWWPSPSSWRSRLQAGRLASGWGPLPIDRNDGAALDP
jgi:hypothetical protein